jgi:hypothetical protein
MTITRESRTTETLNVDTRRGLEILRRETRATGELVRVVTDEGRHLVVWAGLVKAAAK